MNKYKKRRNKLLSLLEKEGIGAFLILNFEESDTANIFYLSGFTGTTAGLLVTKKDIFFTDSRYIEQVQKRVLEINICEVKGKYLDSIVAIISSAKVKRLGISSEKTSYFLIQLLQKKLPNVEIIPLNGRVEVLRYSKDKEEIDNIRNAIRLTELSLRKILANIKEGMREKEIALKLEFIMRNAGAEKVAFDLVVASGENSAMPHHHPSDKKIKKGDLLLMDVGIELNGYCSDMTRVFTIGEASSQSQEIYDIVLKANKAGIKSVSTGKMCKEVDKIARGIIAEAGYGNYFGHATGHGLGIDVHEQPSLSALNKEKLEEGAVVTIEPGIYIPNFGGVRIEDVVLVKDDGCEILTTFPKEKLIVI